MKVIGLDVGDRRIGVAKTDALNITAQGLGLIYVKSKLERTLLEIKDIIEKEEAELLVVGLPKNLNGTLGQQAKKVEEFVGELLNYIDIPVAYFDERLTTVMAQRVLIEADVSRKKRKLVIDEMAAVIILQSWLDHSKRNDG